MLGRAPAHGKAGSGARACTWAAPRQVHARAWPGQRGERAALQRAGKERGNEEKKMEKGKRKRKNKRKKKRRERERGIDGENHGGDRDGRSRVGDRQLSGAGWDGGEEKEGGVRSAEREEKMER